jgi:outer membrane autotransporter protein
MSGPTLKSSVCVALQLLFLVSTIVRSAAQLLVAPPAPLPGATANSLVIDGDVDVDRLTLNVNFFPGNGVGVTANSGTAGLTKTTINLGSSGGVRGIVANGPGATVTLGAGSLVNASGGGGGNFGVQVNGGRVILTDGAFVNMPGGGGSSQVQVNGGGAFDMTGGALQVSGGGGNGIRAGDDRTAGTVSLNGTAVTVLGSGGNSSGVWANISGSNATLVDTSVTVSGPGGGNFGVKATAGAGVNLAAGSVLVNATGDNNIGVLAGTSGSTAILNGTSVMVSGSNSSIGIQADGSNSVLTAVASKIVLTGFNNIGARAQNGASMLLTDTSVTVNGTNGTGVQLTNSGTTITVGGSVETTGTGGQAIFVSGAGANHGTFTGTSVQSDNGTGILAQGNAESTLDFWNSASLTAGNGLLLLDQANGTVNLNGTNQVKFVGDVDATGASGLANVTLRQSSSLTGAINQNRLAGAIEIASAEGVTSATGFTGLPKQNVSLLIDSSLWNMTASSTLNQLEVFPGALINFSGSASGPFRTLVANSLTGFGGTFAMNVDLPNFRGDLLVIQTPTAGFNEHQLQITNLNQGQDPAAHRALLVVISNQTSGLEFPSNQVDAGTFKYESQRGDNTPTTPDPHNWYLVRDDETPQPTPTPGPTPTPIPSPTPGPIPTPTPLPESSPSPIPTPQPTPHPTPQPTPPPAPPGGEGAIDDPKPIDPIQDLSNTANAAIGTYSSTIPLYYADMQTLVERMGELRLGIQETPSAASSGSEQLAGGKGTVDVKQIAPPPVAPATSQWGIWIRGFGSGTRINNDVSRVFNQNVGGMQIGADKRFGSLWNGDLYLGVFGGYIYASRDFLDGGEGNTNAFSLGAYTTWIHPQGWYVDTVLKYTQMWNSFSTPNLEGFTSTGDYNIPAIGGSFEAGRRFDFAGGRLFIEPQGQLAGVWAGGMDYTASNGLRVHGDDQTSLQGRLGGRLGMHFEFSQGLTIEPYAKAEVIQEFLTGDNVMTNSTTFDSNLSGTVGRFGGGLTVKVSQSGYLYGEYDYATGDHFQQPWSISAGLRLQW